MSRHLSALLDHLDIRDPVVVLGQSYGGLICGVHAALIPERLRAIVQVDPTPERADPTIDAGLGTMPLISNLLIGLAMLRVPEPIFGSAMPELP
jgi:pimeloyl-ACP methyl ester carboxylesterase